MPQTFVLPRQVALDDDANSMAGALAYFYQTGTTTPQAVYSDSALTTQHSNPVVADAAGRWAKIYLNPNATANYRVRITDSSGVQVYQEDDIDRFSFSSEELGTLLFSVTDAENSAGVTPSDLSVPSSDAIDDVVAAR